MDFISIRDNTAPGSLTVITAAASLVSWAQSDSLLVTLVEAVDSDLDLSFGLQYHDVLAYS